VAVLRRGNAFVGKYEPGRVKMKGNLLNELFVPINLSKVIATAYKGVSVYDNDEFFAFKVTEYTKHCNKAGDVLTSLVKDG